MPTVLATVKCLAIPPLTCASIQTLLRALHTGAVLPRWLYISRAPNGSLNLSYWARGYSTQGGQVLLP